MNSFGLVQSPSGLGLFAVNSAGDVGIASSLYAANNVNANANISFGSGGTGGTLYGSNGNASITGIMSAASVTAAGALSGASLTTTGASHVGGAQTVGAGQTVTGTQTVIGNLSVSGTSSLQGAVTAGNTTATISSSGASGSVAPMYTTSGTQNSNFHTIFISGSTVGSGACGFVGGSNCYSATLPTTIEFTGLGTYACTPINQVNGTYSQILGNGPESQDGRTFILQGGASGVFVSATCSGY
jgi:hypothetical protein